MVINMMNFQRLEKNLIDVIAEQQIKLGYRRERVELYYPRNSLENLLGIAGHNEDIYEAVNEFALSAMPRLGRLGISNKAERFCIVIPPEGSAYVHGLMEAGDIGGINFLKDFLSVISRHNVTINDVVSVFVKYSSSVHVEKLEDEDFQYLIYFSDGVPDEYRYCINFEGCHAIYHRFTINDYNAFGFKSGEDIPLPLNDINGMDYDAASAVRRQ